MTTKDFAVNLAQIALLDSKASKLLYDQKLFLQSTFYLQQAVEKGTKALIADAKTLDQKEIKSFGHSHPKIYLEVLKRQEASLEEASKNKEVLKLANEVINLYQPFSLEDYNKKITEAKEGIDSIKQLDGTKIEEADLLSLLKALEEINNISIQLPENFQDVVEAHYDSYINFLHDRFYKQISPITKEQFMEERELKEEILKHFPTYLGHIFRLVIAYQVLTTLGFILHDLVSKVRYPFPNDNFNPLVVFVQEHPLIKHQPQIHRLVELNLERLIWLLKDENFN